MTPPLRIGVTGLNAHDNPGPGVSVVRSLRRAPELRDARIVGLCYDSLEPGIYARDLVDDAFLIPYPSQGSDSLLARLEYIVDRVGGLDVIIPTLDSELPAFIALEPALRTLGVAMFLPAREKFELRAKTHLMELGQRANIAVPDGVTVQSESDLYHLHEHLTFPVVIKGVFYGAKIARDVGEAIAAFHETVARWGLPVIAQQYVKGQEYDVVAVGDGEGRLVGAVPMRKTYITDRGKGWAGVAVRDPELLRVTEAFMQASKWRGPCEVEIIKDATGRYQLLEINPRFPAWTYLAAAAGQNLPWAVVQLARGQKVEPMQEFQAGLMFVRIALDQVVELADFEAISTQGELHRARQVLGSPREEHDHD